MKLRTTAQISLVLGIVLGGYLAIDVQQRYRVALQRHAALVHRVGLLDVQDEASMHIRAIETDDSLSFAWQIYLPEGFSGKSKVESSRAVQWLTFRNSHQYPSRYVCRVQFRERSGTWYQLIELPSGSHYSEVIGTLADALEAPESLSIEQIGIDGTSTIRPNSVASLIKIAISNQSLASSRELLFSLSLGSHSAWSEEGSKE